MPFGLKINERKWKEGLVYVFFTKVFPIILVFIARSHISFIYIAVQILVKCFFHFLHHWLTPPAMKSTTLIYIIALLSNCCSRKFILLPWILPLVNPTHIMSLWFEAITLRWRLVQKAWLMWWFIPKWYISSIASIVVYCCIFSYSYCRHHFICSSCWLWSPSTCWSNSSLLICQWSGLFLLLWCSSPKFAPVKGY